MSIRHYVHNTWQCRSTKIQPLKDLESIKQVLVEDASHIRMLLALLSLLSYLARTIDKWWASRHSMPYSLPSHFRSLVGSRKNALDPTIATVLPCQDHWEVMSFLAFNNYDVTLATISFRIASGLGQCKHHSDACAFRATSWRTLTCQEQLAEMLGYTPVSPEKSAIWIH